MTRNVLAVLSLAALAGCVDVSKGVGRYYACNPDLVDDSQCADGWYCAGDRVCRPASQGTETPCERDSQCATGWACNVLGRCKLRPSTTLGTVSFSPIRLSNEFSVERVVVSPLINRQPAASDTAHVETRLFLQDDAGARVLAATLTFDSEEVVYEYEVEPTSVPPPEAEIAVADTLYWAVDGGICFAQDGGNVTCPGHGQLLRSTVQYVPGPLGILQPVALPLWLDGTTVRMGTRSESWDLGAAADPVVDLAGIPQVDCANQQVLMVASRGTDLYFGGNGGRLVTLDDAVQQPALQGRLFTLSMRRLRTVLVPEDVEHALHVLVEAVRTEGTPLTYIADVAVRPCFPPVSGLDGGTSEGNLWPLVSACETGDELLDFARLPDGRIERLCRTPGGAVVRRTGAGLAVSDTLAPAPRVDASAPGVHTWWWPWTFALGRSSAEASMMLPSDQPRRVETRGGLVLAADDADGTYVHRPGLGMLVARVALSSGFGFGRSVQGAPEATVLQNGVVAVEGPSSTEYLAPEGDLKRRRSAAALSAPGVGLVVALDDGWWTPDDDGVLLARARPLAGFDIDSAALSPSSDGGLTGYAVANQRLFEVQVLSGSRITTTEVALGAREVRSVWQQSDGFVAALASGEVVALPSLVALTPPTPGLVEAAGSLCGAPLALSDEQLFVFEDGGWQSRPDWVFPGARGLETEPARAFVTTRLGGVFLLEPSSPSCP
ncbi:MAG: hypothetical protein AB1938_06070 [Myxococcota bacterium]